MNIVSVDLGMGPDPTSVVVIEGKTWEYLGTREIHEPGWMTLQPFFRAPDGSESEDCPAPVFYLRHVERLPPGSPYSRVVARVQEILRSVPRHDLVIDATGVGQAAIELFKSAGLGPTVVTITAGGEVTEQWPCFRVPKRDVISTAQVLLQTDRLKIARDLPNAQLLLRELQGFRMNVDLKKPSDALAWREGANDDLVLAFAVGLWFGERRPGIPAPISVGRSEVAWFG